MNGTRLRVASMFVALLTACGGGDEPPAQPVSQQTTATERRLAAAPAAASEAVFEDAFTRQDSESLGTPTIGGPWVEANELFSAVSSPSRGTVYPANISLTSGALAFNYGNPQQGFGISHAQPRAYAPLSRAISNATLSFTFTTAIGGRTTQNVGLMTAADGFYTNLAVQDYALYYPARGLSIELSRSGVQFPNSSISLLKFDGVGNVTNFGNFPMPFQFAPGRTYTVVMTMANDTFTVNVSNGTQTATASVALNGFTFIKDQLFISDDQGADNGLRFDNFVVVEPTGPPSTPQVLYLNFSQALAPVPVAAFSWWAVHVENTVASYTKPDAGLGTDEIAAVARSIAEIFAPFQIIVTTDQPTSGPYSVVYIGGNRSQLGQPYQRNLERDTFGNPVNYLGIAEQLDLGNTERSDFATVFSGLPDFGTRGTAEFLRNLSLTIAHEAGHIFGLQHIVPSGELMNSSFSAFGPRLSDSPQDIYLPSAGPSGCQNSYQQLGRNVGLAMGLPAPGTLCEILGQISGLRYAGSAGLYGPTLAVLQDGDTGPTLYDLGDLAPGAAPSLQIRIASGAKFAIYASSTPGGPIDIISSPFGPTVLNQFASLDVLTASHVLMTPNASESITINLFQSRAGIGFQGVGSLTLDFLNEVDAIRPATTVEISPPPNFAGWTNATEVLTLNATDNPGGSNVKQINYSMSGSQSDVGVISGRSGSIAVSAEGLTTITYSAMDNAGNEEVPKKLTVRIDKISPRILGLPSSCLLWPPNGKMVHVGTAGASDGLSGLASFIVTGTSNEGSGPDGADLLIVGDGLGQRSVSVRASRLGTGSGRLYTLFATARDVAGNTSNAIATCLVPHDRGHR